MRSFEFTVLGSNSALPTTERNPSAHVLNVHERFYLIDCGEGAQMQMRRFDIKLQRIDHVFISHLHGDHVYGLPGLLGTLHLMGRVKPLTIFAPEGLEEIIRIQHKASDTHLHFPLIFETIDTAKSCRILDNDSLEVSTIPMQHRIPCCGFLFREKISDANIRKEKIEEYNLNAHEIRRIKAGADHRLKDGRIIPNADLVYPKGNPRTFAFCSDTRPSAKYADIIKGADVLYHEATFLDELKDTAKRTGHSTAREAGVIAREANAGMLIIGHFSSRYADPPTALLDEAISEFANTVMAREGGVYKVEPRDVQKMI